MLGYAKTFDKQISQAYTPWHQKYLTVFLCCAWKSYIDFCHWQKNLASQIFSKQVTYLWNMEHAIDKLYSLILPRC